MSTIYYVNEDNTSTENGLTPATGYHNITALIAAKGFQEAWNVEVIQNGQTIFTGQKSAGSNFIFWV